MIVRASHNTACVVLWPGLNSFITAITSTGSYSWKLQESCLNSKEKGKKEGFSASREGKSQRHHTQYKEKLNSLQDVHLQHAVSDLFIPAPYRIPKGTEGGMGLSQTLRQNLRNYFQFWVPSTLGTSGDTPTADTQKSCKFTVYFLTWPGSLILSLAAPHTVSLLDLLWQSKAKFTDLEFPFHRKGCLTLHLFNSANSP